MICTLEKGELSYTVEVKGIAQLWGTGGKVVSSLTYQFQNLENVEKKSQCQKGLVVLICNCNVQFDFTEQLQMLRPISQTKFVNFFLHPRFSSQVKCLETLKSSLGNAKWTLQATF